MKNKFLHFTIYSAIALVVLMMPVMQNPVYADDSQVTYEQAKDAATEILTESHDYIVNFLTITGENSSEQNFSVGELCLYQGLQIELPISVKA